MELDTVNLARLLTFVTLGFHIIFATLGVGVPLFFSVAEWIGIRKKDKHYLLLARRWTRGYVIIVAVGVVTGTCIALQLIFLWPGFMQLSGKVVGLPLFMETFAFFFEAIFLGIYLYTWDRFKNPYYHWLLSLPIIIGGAASAFFITSMNAFMNTPQGFTLENGVITRIDPLLAMFNPATIPKVSHVWSSAYLTAAFILAAIAAYRMLRGNRHEYYKKALTFAMVFCLIFSILNVAMGDINGKFLAKHQPEKLAAGEWHFKTEARAKLLIGGILDEETLEVKYAFGIPSMLSILAGWTPDTVVIGLDQFPRDLWPPLYIHYFMNGMIAGGTYLLLLSILYFILKYWNKRRDFVHFERYQRILLLGIFLGGPIAMLATEFGWIYAEVGRQPWILRGYLKVGEASTVSPYVGEMLVLFSILYLFLGIIVSSVLYRLFRKNTPESELEEKKIII